MVKPKRWVGNLMILKPARFSSVLPRRSTLLWWSAVIALSVVFTAILLVLQVPAARMLGPLIAAIAVVSSGANVKLSPTAFAVAQGILGCMVANMVPSSILGDIVGRWQLFVGGVLAVIVACTFVGWLMGRLGVLDGRTAIWGLSPGGASVMIVMCESYGADVQSVAFMQYSRLVLAAAVTVLVAEIGGVTSAGFDRVWFPAIDWVPLIETMAVATVGALGARRVGIPGGSILVPLVLALVLTNLGLLTIELPPWLITIIFTFIGWNVGLRFTRKLLVHAARQLPRMILCTLVLIAACAGVACALVAAGGIDPLTAFMATSPGGIDTVAIIAASGHVDIAFVMTMQTLRMLVLIFLGPYLAKTFGPTVEPRAA